MKKRLCLALTALLLLTALSGCGAIRKKPEITLNIKTTILQMDNPIDSAIADSYTMLLKAGELFAKQYEAANVHFEVSQFEMAREDEEITGCFDTEDAVDVLYEGYFNMSTYIHTGRVVPLDDIISDALRADIGQHYWDLSTVDGKTYMMPYLSLQNVMCYNKDMFRQAGLDAFISDGAEIQSWTLDEWQSILAALRETLPGTSYPMFMYAASEQGDTHIMTLLRSHGSSFFDESGRVRINTPEGIAALQWLRDCNDALYFPTNSEMLVLLDNNALFTDNQLGIYVTNLTMTPYYADEGIDLGYVNFPSLDGVGYSTSFVTGFEVFDNGDAVRTQAAKDFVKFIYESDWLDYSISGIPVSDSISAQYAHELEEFASYIDNSPTSVDFTSNQPNWRGVRAVFHKHIQDLLYGEKSVEQVAEELDADCNAAIEEGYLESVLHE